MTEIHLYGKLRRYTPENARERGLIDISPSQGDNIEMLIQRAGIPEEEIYHIFYNSKLLVTRNSMAPYLGYRQVRSDPHHWDLDIPVAEEDRIGLFGRDMPALVI